MTKLRALLAVLLLAITCSSAFAVATNTISGTVTDGGGNALANGVITFNSILTQVISGTTVNQTLVSTTTDSAGAMTAISLAQGLYVQITVNGGAPITAIVPFASTTSFAALIANVVANPTTTVLTFTGTTAPSGSAGNAVLYFSSSTNRLLVSMNNGAFANFVTSSSTDTFTNKTYDTAGTGNVFSIGGQSILSVSGNTTKVGTTNGSLTSGNCLKADANGNIADSGGPCGTTATTFMQFATYGTTLSTSATTYIGNATSTVTEAIVAIPVPVRTTLTDFACYTYPSPGVGKSYAFTLDYDAASPSTLTCTISNTASTCGDAINSYDTGAAQRLITVKVVPTGTPTAANAVCTVRGH